MPRQRSNRTTTVLAVRVPIEVAEQALSQCGGQGNLAEWLRSVIGRACNADTRPGYAEAEGWRAGWNAANQQFRAALRNVLANPPPEAP